MLRHYLWYKAVTVNRPRLRVSYGLSGERS